MGENERRDDSRSPETDAAPLIAIVDDDTSVRHSTSRLIRSFGYRAEVFQSGEEFLRSESARRMDCILLDVRMPHMDGLKVAQRLRQQGVHTPIVFFTGKASDFEERSARSTGAAAFLRKPVGRETLLEVLEGVLRGAPPDSGGGDGE